MQRILLLSVLFILNTTISNAQFVKAWGLTIGGTRSNQIWNYDSLDNNLRKKAMYGFNASALVEWLNHDYLRIISEIQYNQKGAKENLAPNDGAKYRTNYVAFNNFLKIRQELYDFTPYFLIGPRLEYLLNAPLPSPKKFHLSASAGIGIEFLHKRPWVFFTEYHINPGVMKSFATPNYLGIRNTAMELRIGIKRELKAPTEKCPPVYNRPMTDDEQKKLEKQKGKKGKKARMY